MSTQKAFLLVVIVLISVSAARADLSLTTNGLDATNKPLEITGKDNLVIAITGQNDIKAQDISVTCDAGKLEPLKKPGKQTSDKYLFNFSNESEVSIISLKVGKEIVYKLILFYIPETDTAIVFGVDKESLAPLQQKSEPELEQEISASQIAEPQKSYFAGMSGGGTTEIESFPEPNSYPDLNGDKIVNFVDFAMFAENWQKSGTGLDGDFDKSGMVDFNDLATFAYFWLSGPHPLDVFQSFKAALAAGDINEAVSYFAYFVADDYRDIFNENADKLPNMVNNMGTLSLEYTDRDIVVYEISNVAGTKFYPVVFTQADNGQWKIAIF
jgi:hypothetical protein